MSKRGFEILAQFQPGGETTWPTVVIQPLGPSLVIGEVVHVDGSYAESNDGYQLGTGVVVDVNGDDITVQLAGYAVVDDGTYTPDRIYFVRPSGVGVAGQPYLATTQDDPWAETLGQPIFYAISATEIWIYGPSVLNLPLVSLLDVDASAKADGKVITYNTSTKKHTYETPSTGVTTLAALTDVNLTSVADLDFLRYDSGSSKWKNYSLGDMRYTAAGGSYGDRIVVGLDTGGLFTDFGIGRRLMLGNALGSGCGTLDFIVRGSEAGLNDKWAKIHVISGNVSFTDGGDGSLDDGTRPTGSDGGTEVLSWVCSATAGLRRFAFQVPISMAASTGTEYLKLKGLASDQWSIEDDSSNRYVTFDRTYSTFSNIPAVNFGVAASFSTIGVRAGSGSDYFQFISVGSTTDQWALADASASAYVTLDKTYSGLANVPSVVVGVPLYLTGDLDIKATSGTEYLTVSGTAATQWSIADSSGNAYLRACRTHASDGVCLVTEQKLVLGGNTIYTIDAAGPYIGSTVFTPTQMDICAPDVTTGGVNITAKTTTVTGAMNCTGIVNAAGGYKMGIQTGITNTATLAKITSGGANGSITFWGGIVTNYTAPT